MDAARLAAFGSWLAARADDAAAAAHRGDADAAGDDRALEIVRDFVAERRLIVFGGLAIDYALRLRGAQLYPDDERPDYDFLSPRSVDDAYDLAGRLADAGFAGVGVVRGIHVQTMRVRADHAWVADVGYAPPDVFARIPTLEWRGLRFAHPDYQRMDMHLSLSFPFAEAPREVVFHRWRKDLARFNLYETHYPIGGDAGATSSDVNVAAPATSDMNVAVVTARAGVAVAAAPGAAPPAVALHGFAAYAVLRAELGRLARVESGSGTTPSGSGTPPSGSGTPPYWAAAARADAVLPRLSITFPDDYTVAVAVPAGAGVDLAAPDADAVAAGLPGATRLEPYMDTAPAAVVAGALTVHSTRNRLLAVFDAEVDAGGGRGPRRVRVASAQYLLLWLLLGAHRAADTAAAAVYRDYYAHTLAILRAAEETFAAVGGADCVSPPYDPLGAKAGVGSVEGVVGGGSAAPYLEAFGSSPFALSVTTLGDVNHSAAYEIVTATNAERLGEPGAGDALAGLPRNYYVRRGALRPPPFDYDASPLFRRSGRPITTQKN